MEPDQSTTLELPLEVEARVFDFSFAFDQAEFSDRTLQIVVETSGDGTPSDACKAQVKINSAVLAAKSRVMRELLSSGVRDSGMNAPIVLKMQQEEVRPFYDMLRFIYSGVLPAHLPSSDDAINELVALVRVGDKFDCDILIRTVLKMIEDRFKNPKTVDRLLSTDLERLKHVPAVEALLVKAETAMVDRFTKVGWTWGTGPFLELSKESVRVLLRSELLEANEEDEIFEYALEWVRTNRASLAERIAVLHELAEFIRFPVMRGETLQEAMKLPGLASSKYMIMGAVWFKTFSGRKRKREPSAVANLQESSLGDRHGVANRGFRQLNCRVPGKPNAELLKNGLLSKSVIVGDTKWCLSVCFKPPEEPRLGIFLRALEVSNLSASSPCIRTRFLARRWPLGNPVLLRCLECTWDLTKSKGSGYLDVFQKTFDELAREPGWFDESGYLHLVAEVSEVK